jgi:hypothetical protein
MKKIEVTIEEVHPGDWRIFLQSVEAGRGVTRDDVLHSTADSLDALSTRLRNLTTRKRLDDGTSLR